MKTKPSPIKRCLFIATASAVVGLMILASGEFVVRWYVEGGPRAALISFFTHRTPMSHLGTNNWLIHDAELGYKLNPRHDEVNSLGIRHPELSLANPNGVFRILVLGDSIAWDEDGFVTLLRERIGRLRAGPIDVINAAVPGYTTYQERRFLERDLLPLRPDLVILQYCLNDNHRFLHHLNAAGNWLITPEALRVLAPEGDDWLSRLQRSSYLMFAIRRLLLVYELRPRKTFPWEDSAGFYAAWQDKTWHVFEEHLLAMRHAVVQIGGRFAVIVVPYEPQLRQDPLDRDQAYTLKPQRMLRQISQEAGVPLLDLFPAFLAERSTKLFTDGIHLTTVGHELVAQQLLHFLEQEKLVTPISSLFESYESWITGPNNGAFALKNVLP